MKQKFVQKLIDFNQSVIKKITYHDYIDLLKDLDTTNIHKTTRKCSSLIPKPYKKSHLKHS